MTLPTARDCIVAEIRRVTVPQCSRIQAWVQGSQISFNRSTSALPSWTTTR